MSRESREGWLIANPPPRTLWERTLGERGYVPVTDGSALIRLRAELPFLRPGSPRVWILENRRAVYLATGQEALLFSLNSKNPPSFLKTEWEPLGFGWDGFGTLLGMDVPILAVNAMSRRATPVRSQKDPREIRY